MLLEVRNSSIGYYDDNGAWVPFNPEYVYPFFPATPTVTTSPTMTELMFLQKLDEIKNLLLDIKNLLEKKAY